MKKLLLVLALTAGLKIEAQNLNVAEHSAYSDLPGNLVTINSKSYYYYLKPLINGCCQDYVHIAGLDASGNTLFDDSISYYVQNTPLKLKKTNDKQLVMLGYGALYCGDVHDPAPRNAFVKLDTAGSVVFTASVSAGYSSVRDIAQATDHTYWVTTDSLVYHYSSAGQFMSQYDWGLRQINSITALPNGHLLFNASISGSLKNIEISSSGSLIAQQSSVHGISKFEVASSGDLYAKTLAGTIEHYNTSLSLLNTCTLSGVSDLTLRNDSVFAVGFNSALSVPYYSVLSASLSVLHYTQSSYKNVQPSGIALTNKNKVSIISGATSNNTLLTYRNFYQLPLTGSFVSRSDAGVTHVSVVSSTFSPERTVFDFYSPPFLAAVLNVTVKNYGADTITSFYLNHSSDVYNMGGLSQLARYCASYHQRFTAIILPGDSVVVQTQEVNSDGLTAPVGSPQGTAVYASYCVFTTAPNASGDTHIDNDAACAQALAYVTGLETQVMQNANISIYPNPFNTSVTLKAGTMIKKLEVRNVFGALQYSAEVNDNGVTIDQAALPAGIYFIKIDTDKGSVVQKLIRE